MSVDKSSRAKTTMTLVSKQDAKVDTHVMLYDQWELNSLLFWRKKALKVELFCPSLQLYSGRESFKRGKFLWWAISIPFYHENRDSLSLINCAFFFTWRVSVLGIKPNTHNGAKRRSLILQLKSFPKLLSDQFIGQKSLFFAAWEVYIRVVIRCSRQSYLSGNMWSL